MSDHLGEQAELYAVGALTEHERKQVDAHVAGCSACLRELGAAESRVTALLDAGPQEVPSSALGDRLTRSMERRASTIASWPVRRSPWLAIAAAVVIVVAPVGFLLHQDETMHAEMAQGKSVIAQLASEPMNSASFASMPKHAIDARVLYNKTGSWYCVIVKNATKPLQVAYVHDGTMEMIGTTAMHGNMALAVLPIPHKMDKLALIDGQSVVAEADLAY